MLKHENLLTADVHERVNSSESLISTHFPADHFSFLSLTVHA